VNGKTEENVKDVDGTRMGTQQTGFTKHSYSGQINAKRNPKNIGKDQGDQIRRIFAPRVIVYFGQLLLKITEEPPHTCLRYFVPWLSLSLNSVKKWVGLHFG
jgi:hypothetical protein